MKIRSLLLVLVFGAELGFSQGAVDITAKMENLGIPLADRYQDQGWGGCGAYARNVWSMKAFDGRLYLGAGNSANGGPASNAGPVPVVCFDPKTGKFAREWNVPDEQIDVFHEFSDGALYIPGHDPKEDWSLGNFYRRAKGADATWEKVRTLPQGVHCYDMAEFDGKLLACGYGTYESTDRGQTFTHMQGPRYYAFFVFPDSVYAVADAAPEQKFSFKNPQTGKVMEAVSPAHVLLAKKTPGREFARVEGATLESVFPDTGETNEVLKVSRPTSIAGKVVYIGGIEHNDHQIQPLGAYVATDGSPCFRAERIPLPAGAVPWYTLPCAGKVALLWATKDGTKESWRNHVSVTSDGKNFREVFYFDAPTFARSMEFLDGAFYFGLGTEIAEHGHFEGNSLKLNFSPKELSPAAGTILRYRATRP